MYRFCIFIVLCFMSFVACQQVSTAADASTTSAIVPDSLLTVEDLPDQKPEDVLRQWYGLIDSNRYHLAKLISTGPMLDLIEGMADSYEFTKKLDPNVLPITTKFLSISCNTNEETATCNCKTEVDGVTQNEAYRLVRKEAHWMMDAKLKTGKPQVAPPTGSDEKYDAVIENNPTAKKKK